jgi:hypothetical protein
VSAPRATARFSILLLSIAGVLPAAGCAHTTPTPSELRARAHIEMLATTIGSRPLATAANARARAYLVGELEAMGFAVRVQRTEFTDDRGITAPVANIIAVRDGGRPEAIALVSHYDSQPDAFGALDDGLGVAICLEAARDLVTSGLRHSLFVILTDGEELGLLGAQALVTDVDVTSRLRAFLNFDGTGAAGPGLLFETFPGSSTALDAWSAAPYRPAGASFYREIYRRLPNDTDFSILRRTGAIGLNFAPVGDSYAYHNDRDVAARVQDFTIRHELRNTVSTVRGIDAAGFQQRDAATTFFRVPLLGIVTMSARSSRIFTFAAVAAACIAWALVTIEGWRSRRALGLIAAVVAALVRALAVAGAMIGATALLRATRAELHPWYAAPSWLLAYLVIAGVAAGLVVQAMLSRLPGRWQPWRGARAVWWISLPVWIALALFLERRAPAAAYLATVPLLAAAIVVLIARRAGGYAWIAWSAVASIVFVVWALDLVRLFLFAVAIFGWAGVVAPVWAQAALLLLGALMIVPPIVAIASGPRPLPTPNRAVAVAVGGALVMTFAGAWMQAAYTRDRPERRSVRYVDDRLSGATWWEVAGLEPRLGLRSAEGPTGWRVAEASERVHPRVGALRQPFVHRADASAPMGAPPATVEGRFVVATGAPPTLSVRVVTTEPVWVRLVLPDGVLPMSASIAGRLSRNQWSATYVSPASTSLDWRLTFAGDVTATALSETAVVLTTSGLPGGAGPMRLPGWLPVERATWQARSVYVLPVLR